MNRSEIARAGGGFGIHRVVYSEGKAVSAHVRGDERPRSGAHRHRPRDKWFTILGDEDTCCATATSRVEALV